MLLRKTALAWAAGFFDGEGHVRTKKDAGKRRAELQVAQKTVECLERLKTAVGSVGTIGGPYHTEYPVYFWYLTRTSDVDKVLTRLWPYLSGPKRRQAEGAGFVLGKIRNPKAGRPAQDKRVPCCHPDRVHVAFGKCRVCYHADRYKELHGK